MKKFLLLPFIIFLSQFVNAQELLFDVKVNTPKIQNVDPKVFKDMETNIQEFLNNRKWTEDVYEQEERIKCQIQLTITEEVSQTSFRADLAIQSTRPIYGSSEETPLLNHVDKDIVFNYLIELDEYCSSNYNEKFIQSNSNSPNKSDNSLTNKISPYNKFSEKNKLEFEEILNSMICFIKTI